MHYRPSEWVATAVQILRLQRAADLVKLRCGIVTAAEVGSGPTWPVAPNPPPGLCKGHYLRIAALCEGRSKLGREFRQ